MLDRIIPIFAVIGMLSSVVYLSLALWVLYKNFHKNLPYLSQLKKSIHLNN